MYMLTLYTLLLLGVCVVAQNGTDVKNLLTKLFTTDGYNKDIRPVLDQSYAVFVYLDFFLSSVIEFDEQEESLKTAGYLTIFWTDEFLTWNPADYNNVTQLFIPQEKIWKPDLALRNTFVTFKGLGSSYLNVIVSYDGAVQWFPFQKFLVTTLHQYVPKGITVSILSYRLLGLHATRTALPWHHPALEPASPATYMLHHERQPQVLQSTCAVNIQYFPFDTQSCDMKFTAWSYTTFDVLLYKGKQGVEMDEYVPNAAWDLVSSSARDVKTEEAAVIFTLNLKRKPTFFLINIITPVILLSFLNVCTFILPVESGEKAGFSVTVFLALAVFLTIISDQLPNNSDRVSLMAVYLSMMTGLSTSIVVVCLIQIRMSIRKESEHPVAGMYVCLVKIAGCIGCKCCCKKRSNTVKPTRKGEKNAIELGNEPQDMTWLDVIKAMDFLFFWFSTAYTVLVTSSLAYAAVNNA